jgi:hypothetical protein
MTTSIISDPSYEKNIFVHLFDAELRADHISDVSYHITLALAKGNT